MRIVVLDEPTESQVETVARALRALDLDEPFLVKDSDNCFDLDNIEQDDCYVSVDSLNNHELINPRNKSYVQVDHNGLITNIREKEVISDLFSVGGYFFTDPEQFLDIYDRLSLASAAWDRELYISDIVASMVLEGTPVLTGASSTTRTGARSTSGGGRCSVRGRSSSRSTASCSSAVAPTSRLGSSDVKRHQAGRRRTTSPTTNGATR